MDRLWQPCGFKSRTEPSAGRGMKPHEIPQTEGGASYDRDMADEEIRWMSTGAAARRLGVTVRTLYRLINEAELPAYKFGRVIRLKQDEVDQFIQASRIAPGSLEHLYPESKRDTSDTEANVT